MNQIQETFTHKNHKALIPYITIGYPNLRKTEELILLLADHGCDIIELGIPFSDPLADGATIQKASYFALQNGVTVTSCLKIAGKMSRKIKIPQVFMTYYNPVLSYGIENFCESCAESNITGLIIPDLPPDEGKALRVFAKRYGLDIVYLLAPNSTDERIKLVASESSGFIYLVSVTGITGARNELPENLAGFVNRVRKVAKQPLCVGFGISTPEQAGQVAKIADGVIIGSKLIDVIDEDLSLKKLSQFIHRLRNSIDKAI